MAQEWFLTVVFGCGNPIMGDDGFGPEVINRLTTNYALPHGVRAVDAGTGVREYLFDYLLGEEGRPKRIIVLDAVDIPGKKPGEVFSLPLAAIPSAKTPDFSLHQFPTVNLLAELQEHTGIRIDVLAAQIEYIPDEIKPGLSTSMKKAIPVACEMVLATIQGEKSVC